MLLVPSTSDAGVDAGGCSATGATGMRACKSPRIGLPASTFAAPTIAEKDGSRRASPHAGACRPREMRTFDEQQVSGEGVPRSHLLS